MSTEQSSDPSGDVKEMTGSSDEDHEMIDQNDEKNTMETKDDDKDMMNMFASVWVKVEVDHDNDEELEDELGDEPESAKDVDYIPTKAKKKKYRPTRQLTCNQCTYTTVYKNCLNIHMASHEGNNLIQCPSCDYRTKYKTSLTRHVNIKHNEKPIANESVFKCNVCEYTTPYKWNLSAHSRKHKLEKLYKCQYCDYKTAYKNNLDKHCKVHSRSNEVFRCDKCPFETKFEGHIHRHLAKIHNEITLTGSLNNVFCEHCDFCTKDKWRMKIHMKRSKRDETITCVSCEFNTQYNCAMRNHRRLQHSNELLGMERPGYGHLNDELRRMLEENDRLLKSQPAEENPVESANVHTNNEEIIDKSGDTKYVLNEESLDWKSILVLESKDEAKPFQCPLCPYISKFKASVQRHFQRQHTSTKNKPYQCCHCDFSTKTKDQISLHNKRSKSDHAVNCRQCNFHTFFKCELVMHQKTHNNYRCVTCNYSCRHKHELARHFASYHIGPGLQCRYCDYKASRKDSLLCHETIHTGVKPFKCVECDYQSIRKSMIISHMSKVHNKGQESRNLNVVSDSRIESLKVVNNE